jgi:N-acetylneuraminic acid mutarotase
MTHRMTGFGLLVSCAILAGCNDNNEPETATAPSAETPSLAVAANSWVTRANIPSVQHQGFATAPVKNSAGQYVVYVIGGATERGGSLSNNLAYNVATNTWNWKKPLPTPLWQTNGAGVIGGKIYVSGGFESYFKNMRNYLYMYDPVANTWTRKANMPSNSFSGVTGVLNNKLYVLTDCGDEDEACFPGRSGTQFYRYDPVTNLWTTLPPPRRQDGSVVFHRYGTGGVIGGKFYVAGGPGARNELDVYDPATNRWTTRAPLPRQRWLVAGGILQSKLYVIGGYDGAGFSRTVSVYDPATNRWTDKAPLPAARSQISASAVALNGQLRMQVLGGSRPNNQAYIP